MMKIMQENTALRERQRDLQLLNQKLEFELSQLKMGYKQKTIDGMVVDVCSNCEKVIMPVPVTVLNTPASTGLLPQPNDNVPTIPIEVELSDPSAPEWDAAIKAAGSAPSTMIRTDMDTLLVNAAKPEFTVSNPVSPGQMPVDPGVPTSVPVATSSDLHSLNMMIHEAT